MGGLNRAHATMSDVKIYSPESSGVELSHRPGTTTTKNQKDQREERERLSKHED